MRPVNEDGCTVARSHRMSATNEGIETLRRKAPDANRTWQFMHGRLLLVDNDRVQARFEKTGS